MWIIRHKPCRDGALYPRVFTGSVIKVSEYHLKPSKNPSEFWSAGAIRLRGANAECTQMTDIAVDVNVRMGKTPNEKISVIVVLRDPCLEV